jgi:hypothetical protein
MGELKIDSQQLSLIAGAVLSLLFSYVPMLAPKYDTLDRTTKQLVMLIVLLVVTLAVFGISCGNLYATGVTCDKQGAVALAVNFILAAVANQSTYALTPSKPSEVKPVKE